MNTIDEPPRPRVPLIATPSNRGEVTTVDAKLINGYLEKGTNKEIFVFKRPGLTQKYDTRSGAGMGFYNWEGVDYSIFGASFYKHTTLIGPVNTAGGRYTFEIIKGLIPKLFFHNTTNAYNYDATNGLVAVTNKAVIVTTGDLTSGSAIIPAIPSTTGITVNSGVEGVGIVPGSYVLTVDTSVQVTLNTPVLATGAATPLTFSTEGFPLLVVPGDCYLDGTTYVMTPEAKIYGSDINDTMTWDALNYLTAQIEPDNGVALAKQLVYVVAFKQWSTELFYDAGNPTGSPLGTVQGNKVNQGCRHAGSIQDLDGVLVWISQTRSGSVGVYAMDNARAQPISTPSVDKLLQAGDYSECYSVDIKINGHRFYVVTLPVSNLTLMYDMSTGQWFQWTDTAGNFFPYLNSIAEDNQTTLLQHATNGKIVEVSTIVYGDEGVAIPWDLYTDNYDGGTRKPKYLYRMDVIGDQVAGSTMTVSCSEDDYLTWSIDRTFDLSKLRPNIRDCGTFLRRAWHFHHEALVPLRLEAVELQIALGTF